MPVRRKDQNGNEILTYKESLFVSYYVENGGNGTKAAIAAGYSEKTAAQISTQNLNKLHIVAAIEERKRGFVKKLDELAWFYTGLMPKAALMADLKELSSAMAQAVDKKQLLEGKPTARTESLDGNRQWAEQQLGEMMREFNLSRDEAISLAKENAPTIAQWVM